jgi:hypothetical protein
MQKTNHEKYRSTQLKIRTLVSLNDTVCINIKQMKRTTCITLLLALFLCCSKATYCLSQPVYSASSASDSVLRMIAENAVRMYGPDYLMGNARCEIRTDTIFGGGEKYRICSTITFVDDSLKHLLEWGFLSRTKIWTDSAFPFEVVFGDGSVVRFSAPIHNDSLNRKVDHHSQGSAIPYGTVMTPVRFQRSEPRKLIASEWDPVFMKKMKHYVRTEQKRRSILTDIKNNDLSIKHSWIQSLIPRINVPIASAYALPFMLKPDGQTLHFSYSVQYSLLYDVSRKIDANDSIEYYLDLDTTQAWGFITQNSKVEYITQLRLEKGRWMPSQTWPVLNDLSGKFSDILTDKGQTFFIVCLRHFPNGRNKKDSTPLLVYRGGFLMCLTDEHKSLPFREVLKQMYGQ